MAEEKIKVGARGDIFEKSFWQELKITKSSRRIKPKSQQRVALNQVLGEGSGGVWVKNAPEPPCDRGTGEAELATAQRRASTSH